MAKSFSIALLGALVGGALGFFLFGWALKQGFYAMIIPGAFLGWGASFGHCPHRAVPWICAVLGLILSLLAEWHFRPFLADRSLPFFLTHVFDLPPMTLLMMAAGTFFAYWLPAKSTRF